MIGVRPLNLTREKGLEDVSPTGAHCEVLPGSESAHLNATCKEPVAQEGHPHHGMGKCKNTRPTNSLDHFFDSLDVHFTDPGVNDEDIPQHHCFALHCILSSPYFDAALGVTIIFNMFLLILETNATASHHDVAGWVTVMDRSLLALYAIELLLRIGVYGVPYFRTPRHWLDIIVIVTDLMTELLTSHIGFFPRFTVLRVFRLLRVGLAFRVLAIFPDLALMLRGLGNALWTIFWGMLLICGMLLVYSVAAVLLIHPVNQRVAKTGLSRGWLRKMSARFLICPELFFDIDTATHCWRFLGPAEHAYCGGRTCDVGFLPSCTDQHKLNVSECDSGGDCRKNSRGASQRNP